MLKHNLETDFTTTIVIADSYSSSRATLHRSHTLTKQNTVRIVS